MNALVLDTSAIIAILQNEPPAERLIDVLKRTPRRRLSASSLLEASIVMFARFGDAGEREVDLFVYRLDVDVIPVTMEHIDIARSAYRRFGKGQHPACLNFGDCFPYALSVSLGEPLLFTGNDFSQTDVDIASF